MASKVKNMSIIQTLRRLLACRSERHRTPAKIDYSKGDPILEARMEPGAIIAERVAGRVINRFAREKHR